MPFVYVQYRRSDDCWFECPNCGARLPYLGWKEPPEDRWEVRPPEPDPQVMFQDHLRQAILAILETIQPNQQLQVEELEQVIRQKYYLFPPPRVLNAVLIRLRSRHLLTYTGTRIGVFSPEEDLWEGHPPSDLAQLKQKILEILRQKHNLSVEELDEKLWPMGFPRPRDLNNALVEMHRQHLLIFTGERIEVITHEAGWWEEHLPSPEHLAQLKEAILGIVQSGKELYVEKLQKKLKERGLHPPDHVLDEVLFEMQNQRLLVYRGAEISIKSAPAPSKALIALIAQLTQPILKILEEEQGLNISSLYEKLMQMGFRATISDLHHILSALREQHLLTDKWIPVSSTKS